MMIEPTTYWHIPRDEDNRSNRWFSDLFDRMWRWHWVPEDLSDQLAKGMGACRQLATGQSVSTPHLQLAIEYLRHCIAWWEAGPWDGVEPYEGRNNDAITDYRNLLDEIEVDLSGIASAVTAAWEVTV